MSQKINSVLFAGMLRSGAASLAKDKTVINDLNVFPIPDGDTGDNMYMTIRAGCDTTAGQKGSLSDIARAAADGMLMGARGNSGVILSRIFAGLAKGLQGVEEADTKAFATAMAAAVKEAYAAIPTPVEGTIITVLREGAEGASGDTLESYFSTLLAAMDSSLEHTPDKLDVLKQAGVVDSGGAGLVCIFRGMNQALGGEIAEEMPEAASAATQKLDLDKFTENSVLEFGYCTEFLLRLTRAKTDIEHFDLQVFIDWLQAHGESVVAFREGSIVKVHVHSFTPGEILNHCQQYGEFLTLKIENMMLQHHQESNSNNASFHRPKEKYGIVTVASGEGLIAAFRECGADVVIPGGQTMNPSTQDFIEAFEKVNADTILVFPNNSNIIMAAEQAAGIYKQADVRVIPSKNFGEGYYGIASADRNCAPDEVVQAVTDAMGSIRCAMVSRAIRNSGGGDGLEITKGDYVGYSGKEILCDAPARETAATLLCEKLGAASADVLLVFSGEDVGEGEAARLNETLAATYPNLEIMFNRGLQPIYDYIFVLC